MFKQILSVAAMATILASVTSCKDNSFKKTKDGLEYRIVTDEKGENAKYGDVIKVHYLVKIGDSVMFDSKKMMNGEPIEMPLNENTGPNKNMDPSEALTYMSAGDSAIVLAALDSQSIKMYPWAKATDKVQFQFKLVSVTPKAKFEEEMKNKSANQAATDDKIITDFLAKNNITAQKTASGLYYVITKPGAGENAVAGKTVKVKYTGRTLDGSIFDSNIEPGFNTLEPLEFGLGQKQVIPGWDEGIALLNKGAKATLYIPSPLAYGEQSPTPKIPANGILMFDVELLDIK